MREQLHGLISCDFNIIWDCYTVKGATIVPQLDARGRVYLSMVLPSLFDNSHSSETVQNWSSAEFPSHLGIVGSGRNIHISDSDLDNLKMFWGISHSQIQRLSKEDGIPLLRIFLNIRQLNVGGSVCLPPDKIYFGRIFGQYTDARHERGSFSESTAHLTGRIKLQGRPTPMWYSKGWTEVTTGLWRRRSVRSDS